MIQPISWKDRTFTFDLPAAWFPALLTRLQGTPVRIESFIDGITEPVLSRRPGDHWSVKEHIGHLDDLDELDQTRLREFLDRADTLTAADMRNRKTEEAEHNATPARDLVHGFKRNRQRLVNRLETLTQEDVEIAALHTRLGVSMRLIDWVYFVAEHDDHHLAHIRAILYERSVGQS